MPETLTDILAAAAHDVGLSDPGHCLHNAYGSECVDVMSRVLAAIPARDREAWETGRALAECIAQTPDGWRTCELKTNEPGYDVGDGTGWVVSVASPEWWSGESDDRDAHLRIGHGETPLAALTALLARLDPTR